jgi:hypothetical protein
MKKSIFYVLTLAAIIIIPAVPQPAAALSCLPVDMYLKDIVSKEDIVIFEGTSIKQIKESAYTTEVVTVTDVLQGYVETKTFVYHQKDETWGYLCNPGPSEKANATSVYVAGRDNYGKYMVYQRLELDSDNLKTLKSDLSEAEVTGEVMTITPTDRMNQIFTTISEMLGEIIILLNEHAYWKSA